MHRHEFSKIIQEVFETINKLNAEKGAEYCHGDADALANFRGGGVEFQLPPEVIWGVYTKKHWDAEVTYIQDLMHGVERVRSENLEGRALDIILYHILFIALFRERNRAKSEEHHYQVEVERMVGEGCPVHDPRVKRDPTVGELKELAQRRSSLDEFASGPQTGPGPHGEVNWTRSAHPQALGATPPAPSYVDTHRRFR